VRAYAGKGRGREESCMSEFLPSCITRLFGAAVAELSSVAGKADDE
jgi:hypothetical protein